MVEDKDLHELDFADPEIHCDFTYDKSVSSSMTSMVLELKAFQNYRYNSTNGQIEKYPLESGENREISAFRLEKGKPATMYVNVQEISENTVQATNEVSEVEQLYYPGSAWVVKPPYVSSVASGHFKAKIVFALQWRMTYNNYKASFIDALQKLALVCVIYFLFVLITRFFVRRNFYR